MKRRRVSQADTTDSDNDTLSSAATASLNYDDIQPNCFYLVDMDTETESHPSAVVKVVQVVPPANHPRGWQRMTPDERHDHTWNNSELQVEWMLRREDTAICMTHRRTPTRTRRGAISRSDTREFVRQLPEGVQVPDNLLWLCADPPDPDWVTLRPGNLLRQVRVHWLPATALVPPLEPDVFYYKMSYSERFYRSVYVGPDQRAHQPIPQSPSPLASLAKTAAEAGPPLPAPVPIPDPASVLLGPQKQKRATAPPTAREAPPAATLATPVLLPHDSDHGSLQRVADPPGPCSSPGTATATPQPAKAEALATDAGPSARATPKAAEIAACGGDRGGGALPTTTAAAASTTPLLPPGRLGDKGAAGSSAPSHMRKEGPKRMAAPASTLRLPGQGMVREVAAVPPPGPVVVEAGGPRGGGRGTGNGGGGASGATAVASPAGIRAASGWLPPLLRYPRNAEPPGGREARLVPFKTARGRVPPTCAGDRSDAPGLRPRGPCASSQAGEGRPNDGGEGRPNDGGEGSGRILKALQLCCGAGCLSLRDWFGQALVSGSSAELDGGGSGGGGGVDQLPPVVDCWGVDLDTGACTTFVANSRGADVIRCRVDEFLELVRRYNSLLEWLRVPTSGEGASEQPAAPTTPAAAAAVAAVSPSSGAPIGSDCTEAGVPGGIVTATGAMGSGSGGDSNGCELCDILAVRVVHCGSIDGKGQLLGRLQTWTCWLEVLVRGSDPSSDVWRELNGRWGLSDSHPYECAMEPPLDLMWLPVEVLLRGPHASAANMQLLRDFMAVLVAEDRLPRVGDVFAVLAGTPCQNFTGLNRHAPRENIMADNKNRLILPVMELVQLLRPKYIVLEQVPAAVHKEKGVWVRTVFGWLEQLEYQRQLGDIAAGAHFGVEGRQRIIVVATAHGWPAPPFPRPACHHMSKFNRLTLELCRPLPLPSQPLLQQPTNRDAFSDLLDKDLCAAAANWKMSPLGKSGLNSDYAAAAGAAATSSSTVPMPSPLQLAAATAEPPPFTTPRESRLAISYGFAGFELARLARAARDLYELERRHCLHTLGMEAGERVITRGMAQRRSGAEAAVDGKAAAVGSEGAGGSDGGRGGGTAAHGAAVAAEGGGVTEQLAHKHGLVRVGGALRGDGGEPGPAAEAWISSNCNPAQRELRRKTWAAWIPRVQAEHADKFMKQIDAAEAEFLSLAPRCIAVLDAELRLANGEEPKGGELAPAAAAAAAGAAAAAAGAAAGAASQRQWGHHQGRPRAAAAPADSAIAAAAAPAPGCQRSPGGSGEAVSGSGTASASDGGFPCPHSPSQSAFRGPVANHVPLRHGVADVERFRLIPAAVKGDTCLADLPAATLRGMLPCGHWLQPPPVSLYEQPRHRGPSRSGGQAAKAAVKTCRATRDDNDDHAKRDRQPTQGQQAGRSVRYSESGYTRQGWGSQCATIDAACCEAASRPVLHPLQDRVLTVREQARQHAVPDYHVFCTIPSAIAPWVRDVYHNVPYRDIVRLALRGLRFAAVLWGCSVGSANAGSGGSRGTGAAWAGGPSKVARAAAGYGEEGNEDGIDEDAFAEVYRGTPASLRDAEAAFVTARAAVDASRRVEYRLVAESVSPAVSAALAAALRLVLAGVRLDNAGGQENGQGDGQAWIESPVLAAARRAGWSGGEEMVWLERAVGGVARAGSGPSLGTGHGRDAPLREWDEEAELEKEEYWEQEGEAEDEEEGREE